MSNALHRDLEKLIEQLEKESAARKDRDDWRPAFHLTPPVGWLNDPNGLCWFQGKYHVFFQYSPFDVNGGLKFWGHYTSADLVNWQYEGTAMYPDMPYDCHGVYSGSALVENDTMYLFYTGNVKYEGNYNYITDGRGSNTIMAVCRDGIHVGEKKLLMENKDYPADLTCHVRDPKVWKDGDTYYMVQGARTKEDVGQVLVFASADLESWKVIHRIASEEPFGYMWECPDLFELDGKTILSVSPQGIEAQGLQYNNKYQTGYYFLEGDFKTDCTLSAFTEMDHGFDFYAPQTFVDGQGRRILIGWMGAADSDDLYTNPTTERGWNQALTVPRRLFVKNGKLCQLPVEEISRMWQKEEHYQGAASLTAGPFELDVTTEDGDVSILLAEGLALNYRKETGIFSMEFFNSIGSGRDYRGTVIDRLEQVKVLADTSSVEVFVNGGEEVFTTRYYPAQQVNTIQITGAVKDIIIRK